MKSFYINVKFNQPPKLHVAEIIPNILSSDFDKKLTIRIVDVSDPDDKLDDLTVSASYNYVTAIGQRYHRSFFKELKTAGRKLDYEVDLTTVFVSAIMGLDEIEIKIEISDSRNQKSSIKKKIPIFHNHGDRISELKHDS